MTSKKSSNNKKMFDQNCFYFTEGSKLLLLLVLQSPVQVLFFHEILSKDVHHKDFSLL